MGPVHRLSKKSEPKSYSRLLFKMSQDFLYRNVEVEMEGCNQNRGKSVKISIVINIKER